MGAITFYELNEKDIVHTYVFKISLFSEQANELRITSLSMITLLFKYSFHKNL